MADATLRLRVESAPAERGARRVERALGGVTTESRRVRRALGMTSRSGDDVGRSFSRSERQMQRYRRAAGATATTTQQLTTANRGLATSLGALVTAGALWVTVGRGLRAVNDLVAESITLYVQQAQAVAQVRAGLESTQGVAGITLQEIKDIASELQSATGIGDEVILGVQSKILTFTGVTRDNFAEVTEAVLDLSTRMEGDLTGAVVQLGKAFNDPVSQANALSRAGIILTDQQKEQIKVLWESGRRLEAQAILMAELRKEFGGSARAAGDAAGGGFKKLDAAVGDLKEAIGAGLVPLLDEFARSTVPNVERATGTLESAFRRLPDVLAPALISGARLIDLLNALGVTTDRILSGITAAAASTPLGAALKSLVGIFEVFELPIQGGENERAMRAFLDRVREAAAAADAAGPPVQKLSDYIAESGEAAGKAAEEIDNWIHVVEQGPQLGRLGVFNVTELEEMAAMYRAQGEILASIVTDEDRRNQRLATAHALHEAKLLSEEKYREVLLQNADTFGDIEAAAEQAGGAFTDAFGQAIGVILTDFENAGERIFNIFRDTLSRIIQDWIKRQIVANVAVNQTGGAGGGSLTSLFGGAGGASGIAALGFAALGAYIVYKGFFEERIGSGSAQIAVGAGGASVQNAVGSAQRYLDAVRSHGQAVVEGVDEILGMLDATVESLTQAISIGQTGDSTFTVLSRGVTSFFTSAQEAIEFATIRAVQEAELSGISPATVTAIQNSTARTLEQFYADLDFARWFEEISLPVGMREASANISQWARDWDRAADTARSLGLAVEVVDEEFLRLLESMIAGAATAEEVAALRGGAEGIIAARELEIAALQEQAERMRSIVGGMVEFNGRILDAGIVQAQRLAEIEAEIARLTGLNDATREVLETARPRGRGRGRRDARERFEEEINDIVRTSGLSDWSRAVVDTIDRIDELRRRQQELGADYEQTARAIGLLQEELRDRFRDLVRGNLRRTLTGLQERRKAIEDEFEAAREANERALEETGELTIARWKLLAAERAAREFLAGEALVSLGTPTEETRRRFNELAETLQFLQEEVADGIIPAERLADALGELGDIEFVNLADQLLGFVERYFGEVEGFEEFRIQLERTRFELERANLMLQFELLQEMGLLTEEQIRQIQGTLDWINDNVPTFGAPDETPGQPTYDPNQPAREAAEARRKIQEELARARADALRDLIAIERSFLPSFTQDLLEATDRFAELGRVLGNSGEMGERLGRAWDQTLEGLARKYIDPLRQARQDLLLSEGGPLNQRNRFDLARSQFQEALGLLRGGDFNQLDRLRELVGIVQQQGEGVVAGQGRKALFRELNLGLLEAERLVREGLGLAPGQPIGGESSVVAQAVAEQGGAQVSAIDRMQAAITANNDTWSSRMLEMETRIANHTRHTADEVAALRADIRAGQVGKVA